MGLRHVGEASEFLPNGSRVKGLGAVKNSRPQAMNPQAPPNISFPVSHNVVCVFSELWEEGLYIPKPRATGFWGSSRQFLALALPSRKPYNPIITNVVSMNRGTPRWTQNIRILIIQGFQISGTPPPP